MKEKAIYEFIPMTPDQSLRLFHEKVPIEDTMPFHHHPVWEITWIMEGYGERLTGGNLEECRSGEVILIPPELPHGWIFSKKGCLFTENITIQFPEKTVASISVFPELQECISTLRYMDYAVEITGETCSRIRTAMERLSESDATGRITELISMIPLLTDRSSWRIIGQQALPDCRNGSNSKRMETVYSYVLAHYSDRITLSEIASAINMSETSFCCFFKKHAKEPFYSFLNRFRVEIAAKMLRRYPECSVSDIAFRCGFNDVPHFHRLFRRYTGKTPGSLRKQEQVFGEYL